MTELDIDETLQRWKSSLCPQVSVAGWLARSATAYKWKATLRSITLRECLFWRVQDLLSQAQLLHGGGHTLGSRILIRSAVESVATLIHLNQLTTQVLDGILDFHIYDRKTRYLLLGSRDGSTKHESINIVTVLSHCNKKYVGLSGIYATLSECAHPNYEGVCIGYSSVDFERYETNFFNRWHELWADRHDSLMKMTLSVFEEEYNVVWPELIHKLETWLVENDRQLEARKVTV